MPGEGGVAYATCGAAVRAISCPGGGQSRLPDFAGGDHTRRVVLNRCGRPDCPECYDAWVRRQADRAAQRLEAARELYARARRKGGGRVVHVVLSPPRGLELELSLEQLRARARALAKRYGWMGGAEILHPWRSSSRGATKKYRQGKNFYSPHVHLVGFGFLELSARIYAETGWVVKNLGSRGSVAGTIAYLLEHAGVKKGSHVVKWTGSVAYNKVVIEREETLEELAKCPCGRTCLEHPVGARGDVLWQVDDGPAYLKVRKRTYRLRARASATTAVVRATTLEAREDTQIATWSTLMP